MVNHLQDVSVSQVELANIDTDAFYDAVTVRIFASMKDYTPRGDTVVEGDANRVHPFSEYWTFIRSTGFKPTAASDKGVGTHCPNCGSPLSVSMTGVCSYCDSVITTGQFGWVLTAIQQDEEYRA